MKLFSFFKITTATIAAIALTSGAIFGATGASPIKVLAPGGAASGVDSGGGSSSATVTVQFNTGPSVTVVINQSAGDLDWMTAHAIADALNQDTTFRGNGARAIPVKLAGDPVWYIAATSKWVPGAAGSFPSFQRPVFITCVTASSDDTLQAVGA